MSSVQTTKLTKSKRTDEGVSYAKAAYVKTAMYSEQTVNDWMENVIEFLRETRPRDFPEDLKITYRLQAVPMSLIDVTVKREGSEIPIRIDYLSKRAEFEAQTILATNFEPAEENNNENTYFRNASNRTSLERIIRNQIAPRAGFKYTNKFFKVLSDSSYFISDCPQLIRVLKGQFPDGTIRRNRDFIGNSTEEDVVAKRQELLNENADTLQVTELSFKYLPYKIDDIENIFYSMIYSKNEKTTELLDHFDTIFDYCKQFVSILVDELSNAVNNENEDEDNEEWTKVIGFGKGKAKTFFTKMIKTATPRVEYLINGNERTSGAMKILNLESTTHLSNKDYIPNLCSVLLRCLFEERDLEEKEKESERKKKVDEKLLEARGRSDEEMGVSKTRIPIQKTIRSSLEELFKSKEELMELFLDAIPTDGSFTLNLAASTDFRSESIEPIESYLTRTSNSLEPDNANAGVMIDYLENALKTFISMDNLKLQYSLRKTAKRTSKNLSPREYGFDNKEYNLLFNVNGLCEIISKVTGESINVSNPLISGIVDNLRMMAEERDEITTKIEKEIDDLFGKSKIVKAIDIPQLELSPLDSCARWFESKLNYLKYEIKKYIEKVSGYMLIAVFELVFEDILKDHTENLIVAGDERSRQGKFYNVLSATDLENIIIKVEKYILYSEQTNFQPEFQDFLIKSEYLVKIGVEMNFIIGRKNIVKLEGSRYVSKSIDDMFFEKNDNPQVRKTVKREGREELIKHFTELFSYFAYSGGAISVDIQPIDIKNEDGNVRESINLTVKFATAEDTFICSKFCTKCFTSKAEDILEYTEKSDRYEIGKEYIITFSRTGEQQSQFGGEDNEKTLEAYEKLMGCEEQYPFVSKSFNTKEILTAFQSQNFRQGGYREGSKGSIRIDTGGGAPILGTIDDSWNKFAKTMRKGSEVVAERIHLEEGNDILTDLLRVTEARMTTKKNRQDFIPRNGGGRNYDNRNNNSRQRGYDSDTNRKQGYDSDASGTNRRGEKSQDVRNRGDYQGNRSQDSQPRSSYKGNRSQDSQPRSGYMENNRRGTPDRRHGNRSQERRVAPDRHDPNYQANVSRNRSTTQDARNYDSDANQSTEVRRSQRTSRDTKTRSSTPVNSSRKNVFENLSDDGEERKVEKVEVTKKMPSAPKNEEDLEELPEGFIRVSGRKFSKKTSVNRKTVVPADFESIRIKGYKNRQPENKWKNSRNETRVRASTPNSMISSPKSTESKHMAKSPSQNWSGERFGLLTTDVSSKIGSREPTIARPKASRPTTERRPSETRTDNSERSRNTETRQRRSDDGEKSTTRRFTEQQERRTPQANIRQIDEPRRNEDDMSARKPVSKVAIATVDLDDF